MTSVQRQDAWEAAAGGDLTPVLAALSSGLRREILELLLDRVRSGAGGMRVTEIADELGIDRFTASRHLSRLRQAGLVTEVVSGRARIHLLELDAITAITAWLDPFFRDMDWREHSAGFSKGNDE